MYTEKQIRTITRQQLEQEIQDINNKIQVLEDSTDPIEMKYRAKVIYEDNEYLNALQSELYIRNNPPPPAPEMYEGLLGCLDFVLVTVGMIVMFIGWFFGW